MTRHIVSTAALLLVLATGCNHRTPSESDLFNTPAAIPSAKLPYNPLSWTIITTGIDSQQHAMSALYGNDLAIQSARSGQPTYPQGAVLSLITWSQREDPHWFGGRIPNNVQSIEFVTIGQKDAPAAYQRYDGPTLERVELPDAPARCDSILSTRAAIMP